MVNTTALEKESTLEQCDKNELSLSEQFKQDFYQRLKGKILTLFN